MYRIVVAVYIPDPWFLGNRGNMKEEMLGIDSYYGYVRLCLCLAIEKFREGGADKNLDLMSQEVVHVFI